ncbi:response regulator [Gorillibacterium sp. sgz500922]|uniref:response regulator transcription factor n=1 Tax=Gorillibacterium sp. sgz500922 TaxID=3446694 RepID=UPI003F678EE8
MEKLKVLLVDDEYLIRNLLRMRIDWENQGLSIVGEASNAEEALELVDRLRPDIIFTDIYMPNINGIEFSGRVLKKYPHIKIVVVTGHDEFAYAQQGIKIGISDFILKPIRATDLLHVTDKLKGILAAERTREKELEKLKRDLERNFPYLREKFLHQWLEGALTKAEIQDKASDFKLPELLQGGAFQIAVIELSPPVENQAEEQLLVWAMECHNSLHAFFRGNAQAVILSETRTRYVLIFFNPKEDSVGACKSLIAHLIGSSTCTACIGIGRRRENIAEAHLGYQEACRAVQDKAFVGHNQVVCIEDRVDVGEKPDRPNPELLRQLGFYVSVGSSHRAMELLRLFFDASFSGVAQFRMAAMGVITECQRATIEQQLEDEQALSKDALGALMTADTLPDVMRIVENYVLHVTEAIQVNRQAKDGNLISQVKEYLECNMHDPQLGLASTAAAFFVSPGHLGRLMKKETGQTFVEYLTAIRMKRAETLLKTTDLRGYEIGEQVGITDPHYFSTLFKKTNGRSMMEYRCSK